MGNRELDEIIRKSNTLNEMVHRENHRQRARVYSYEQYREKWIRLFYFPLGGMEAIDVIRKDTPQTVEGYDAAIRAMTACVAECM